MASLTYRGEELPNEAEHALQVLSIPHTLQTGDGLVTLNLDDIHETVVRKILKNDGEHLEPSSISSGAVHIVKGMKYVIFEHEKFYVCDGDKFFFEKREGTSWLVRINNAKIQRISDNQLSGIEFLC